VRGHHAPLGNPNGDAAARHHGVARAASVDGIRRVPGPGRAVAAINLFSSVGPDFHASPERVMWVTGAAAAVSSALGALAGGWLADRISRTVVYLSGGALAGMTAFAMAFGPHNVVSYSVGVLTYNAIAGVCYAAYSALSFELIGNDNPTAATQF